MRARRKAGREEIGTGESMRDPEAEGIAYSAGAAAPPTPGVTGDREVGIGPSFMPVAPDDTMMAESVDPLDPYSAADAQQTSAIREPGTVRSRSGAQPAIPDALNPLRSDDGRIVSVVHIVAELAPFARTGGLGEAVKSLAEFQSASGIPTAIIMPLYRQVHAVAPNLEPVGEPFMVQVGPMQEQARLFQITPDRRSKSRGFHAPRRGR